MAAISCKHSNAATRIRISLLTVPWQTTCMTMSRSWLFSKLCSANSIALHSAVVAAKRDSSGSDALMPATTAVRIILTSCGLSTCSLIWAISSHTYPMACSVAVRVPGTGGCAPMVVSSVSIRVCHSLRTSSIAATLATTMAAVCRTSGTSACSVASSASRTCCRRAGSRPTHRVCNSRLRASSFASSTFFIMSPARRLLSAGLALFDSSADRDATNPGKFCSWKCFKCCSAVLRMPASMCWALLRISVMSMTPVAMVLAGCWLLLAAPTQHQAG
mmetsp:Transcript_31301/g.93410  ORF Transcript_31301/g.93410 Transcript_31301/m.93410 type:complete len:275 (+) Transcript_31301:2531-3355(+)